MCGRDEREYSDRSEWSVSWNENGNKNWNSIRHGSVIEKKSVR